jgi:large conductance mechanosensitive channel
MVARRKKTRKGMTRVLNEFKPFLLRGNVVDLAVAVVIGVAFGAVVTALVEDLVTPVIAAIVGEPDFSALDFTINDSTFRYGHFLNAVAALVLIAAAMFFFVVMPINSLREWSRTGAATRIPPLVSAQNAAARSPIQARRCAFCTGSVGRTRGVGSHRPPTDCARALCDVPLLKKLDRGEEQRGRCGTTRYGER